MLSSGTLSGAIIQESLRSGALPTGWSGTNIVFETAAGGYARLSALSATLATPPFDASQATSIVVEFAVAKWGTGGDGPITVEYQLGDGNWIFVGDSPTPTSAEYMPASITIAASSPTMQVRFLRYKSPSQKRLRDVVIRNVIVPTNPTLTMTPTALSIFETIDARGPSEAQSYTLSAANLEGAGFLRVTAPASYELSTLPDSAFGATLDLPYDHGILTAQPVLLYVRLRGGLAPGGHAGAITHEGGGLGVPSPAMAVNGVVDSAIRLTRSGYEQRFDGLALGLPEGVRVVTGATTNFLGTRAPFSTVHRSWGDTAGAFKNLASAVGLSADAGSTAQSNSVDRALGLRCTGAFGDPGAAFVFTLADTAGLVSIGIELDFQMLSVQPRSQIWTVDYRTSTSSGFTPLGVWADPGAWQTTTLSWTLGPDANNHEGPVYIRVATLAPSTGSDRRDTIAIDRLTLTASKAPGPPDSLFIIR